MKYIVSILVLFTGFTAFADADQEVCFNPRSISNWRAIDNDTLDVWGRGRRFRVQTWPCWELKWSNRIAFRSFSNFRVCRGDDVLVLDDFSNKVIDRCAIRRIDRVAE